MEELKNFIGGEWLSTSETLDNIEPATGAVVGHIPKSGKEEANAAVAVAKAAQPGWAATPVETRARMLERIADAIEARLEDLAAAESRDVGKPVGVARVVDIPRAVHNFRFFASAVRTGGVEAHPMSSALNYTVRRPVGVAALISPWNLPLYLLTWKTAPALAMGNTVVAKPSEMTPTTATMLAQIMEEVGLPPGVFNLVHGLGAEAGEPLLTHPDVSAVSFTGGTQTGRRVAECAAPLFKKVSLELGGKNPTVVFADCDFDAAVATAARAAFANQGEICLCGSRILIEKSIYERFVEALTKRVQKMRVSDPTEKGAKFGALISQAHRDKVESYVNLAKEEGGRVLCGGKRAEVSGRCADGFFFEPTLIDGLPIGCRTATEEIFGPVATLHPFETEDEAVSMANAVEYGLASSVWTRDLRRAHRVAERIESGMVWVNTWLLRDLRVPFGGMKQSGVGREGGRHSLEFFSEERNICVHLEEPRG